MDLNSIGAKNSSTQSFGSRRSSIDSNSSRTSRSRLSRLLPGRGRRRSTAQADAARRRLIDNEKVPEVRLNLADSDTEDVITVDDAEGSSNDTTRPHLSPHNSHKGFLTLSSPLIPAEPITKSSTVASTSSQTAISPSQTATLTALPSTARRSPSPAGRLREAFGTAKTKTPSGPIVGGGRDVETSKEGGGRGSLTRVFSRGRRPSETPRPESQTPPRALNERQLVEEPGEKTPSPKKPLPKPISTIVPNTPPATSNGPETFVTPPTPTDQSDAEAGASDFKKHRRGSSGSEFEGLSGEVSNSHRRAKSAQVPSKLSQYITRPLTPALEEIKTPGGTLSNPQASNSFFSSVLSAAQNAATSLSNTISIPGQKSKTGNETVESNGIGQSGGEEVIVFNTQASSTVENKQEDHKPAIETLGSGNLSLSHLGITDGESISPFSSKVNLMETANGSNVAADEASARKEDNAAAQAVSKAYTTEKVNGDKPSPEMSRSSTVFDDATPIKPSIESEAASIKRASSVRSKLSEGKRRRTRGSSATASLAPALSSTPTVRFAFASPKRNKDFHNQFKSVPEDDLLIEDYSAALQREILLQGRLYISEGHICFWSNIFGYVTALVMSLDEVISVEKRSTAMIFQNGIAIQTMHAKHVFASLLSRDTTYDLIISIWRANHPNLRSSLNGNPVDGTGTGDKTEKAASIADDDSASEEIYDEDLEDDHDDDSNSYAEARDDSVTGSYIADTAKAQTRKVSAQVAAATGVIANAKTIETTGSATQGTATTVDYPGPATHEPTDCGDATTHCEKSLLDATVPAPLGKVFSLIFGSSSKVFMRRFLGEDEKCSDIQQLDESTPLGPENKSRNFSYIKPLNAPVGPKQTKCIITETLEQYDLERAASVLCSTQTPDVPSGSAFVTKTKYCLMWAPGNGTKIIMTYVVEWTGKSWLKGPIEKGAADGQLAYANSLAAALKQAVSKTPTSKSKSGKSRSGRRKRDTETSSPEPHAAHTNAVNSGSNWQLEKLLAEPTNLAIMLLCLAVLILLWRGRNGSAAQNRIPPLERQIAYDKMWRSQETELWRWIEERVGLQELREPGVVERKHRTWASSSKRLSDSFANLEGMAEREVMEAIRVTKDRLERLEGAVKRTKGETDEVVLEKGRAEL